MIASTSQRFALISSPTNFQIPMAVMSDQCLISESKWYMIIETSTSPRLRTRNRR